MWISRGAQQIAEDRGGKVAAVAPERGLDALRVTGDESGHDQRGRRLGADDALRLGARGLPAHGRAQVPPLHLDHVPRVHPADAGPPAARHQGAGKEAGRPQLPEPDDEVARGGRGRPRQPHRLQQGGDVLAVCVQRARIGPRLGFRAQGRGHVRVPRPQPRQRLPGVFLPLRGRHQGQKRVRDAPARRQHHGQASGRLALDDGRHALHAGSVGHAGAAEFEDAPGILDRVCGPDRVHICLVYRAGRQKPSAPVWVVSRESSEPEPEPEALSTGGGQRQLLQARTGLGHVQIALGVGGDLMAAVTEAGWLDRPGQRQRLCDRRSRCRRRCRRRGTAGRDPARGSGCAQTACRP